MFNLLRSVCDGISVIIFIIASVILLVHFYKSLIGLLHHEAREGDHVLITGCDSGFGYESALELSRRKCFVFAGCLCQQGVEKLQNDPTFNGMAFIMDITKSSDIENARRIIEKQVKEKGLWAVVNNAGIQGFALIEWSSVERMQKIMNVNLWGMVNVTKAMLPLVKKARGRVVNMSSMGGRISSLMASAYSMSKFAAEAFSDGLRYEMKPWNVSVHIIEPGAFRTEITNKSQIVKEMNNLWESQSEEIKESYGEEYCNWFVNWYEKSSKFHSPHTYKVVNTICHAVSSPSPKSRYVVGLDANTLFIAIATLPTSIADFIHDILVKLPTPAAMKI